jgi:hypothetical protein
MINQIPEPWTIDNININTTYYKKKTNRKQHTYNKKYKIYFIFLINTNIQPKAMMIPILNAFITSNTMLHLFIFNGFTNNTNII